MNFRESMIKAMTTRGMDNSQAKEIIDSYIVSNENNPMMDRWYEDINGYPDTLGNILWMGVKDYAFKWIVQNKPEAWFRPIFEFSEAELIKQINDKKGEDENGKEKIQYN